MTREFFFLLISILRVIKNLSHTNLSLCLYNQSKFTLVHAERNTAYHCNFDGEFRLRRRRPSAIRCVIVLRFDVIVFFLVLWWE